MDESVLTEGHIALLVQTFYDRVRLDDELGPVFNSVVKDWEHHHDVVADFWSRTLLGTQRYQRHPFAVHQKLPIRREHFGAWLALFRETAQEILPPEAAKVAIGRAEFMAQSFRTGLFPLDPVRPARQRGTE